MNGQVLARKLQSSLSARSRKLKSNIADDRNVGWWTSIPMRSLGRLDRLVITRQIVWLPGFGRFSREIRFCVRRIAFGLDRFRFRSPMAFQSIGIRRWNRSYGRSGWFRRFSENERARRPKRPPFASWISVSRLVESYLKPALVIFESLEFD